MEEENIVAYLQRVEEVVNTMRGLEEEIKEIVVVQKILKSLPSIFNPKFYVVQDRDTLDQLKLDELHGILMAYEMRIEDSKPKEVVNTIRGLGVEIKETVVVQRY